MSLSIRFQGLAHGQVRPALADLLFQHFAGSCSDDVPVGTPHGFVNEISEEFGSFFLVAYVGEESFWLNDYIGLLSDGQLPTRY